MDKTTAYKRMLALGAGAMVLAATGCSQLQGTLSSVQQQQQEQAVGYATATTKTFWYNAADGQTVAETDAQNAHLVLGLYQLADASDAKATYTLEYTYGGVTRTASADVTGTSALSTGKTKYYVDVSPALKLIDGTDDLKYGSISYAITVKGLKNATGTDYDGRAFPAYSATIAFAPLYTSDALEFSSHSLAKGSAITIPLNGTITAVDPEVTVSVTEGTLADGAFTASVAEGGTGITLTATTDLAKAECTADLTLTGIKALGSAEEYTHTFTGVVLTDAVVVTKTNTIELKGDDQQLLFGAEEFNVYADIYKMQCSAKLSGTVEGSWWAGLCDSGGGNYLELKWSDATSENEGTAKRDSDLISAAKTSGLYIKGLAGLKAEVTLMLSVPADSAGSE